MVPKIVYSGGKFTLSITAHQCFKKRIELQHTKDADSKNNDLNE